MYEKIWLLALAGNEPDYCLDCFVFLRAKIHVLHCRLVDICNMKTNWFLMHANRSHFLTMETHMGFTIYKKIIYVMCLLLFMKNPMPSCNIPGGGLNCIMSKQGSRSELWKDPALILLKCCFRNIFCG